MAAFDPAWIAVPHRMQPGLRRLPDAQGVLTPVRPGSRHQREKLAVLGAFAVDALAVEHGFDPAPALQALCAHAAAAWPAHWRWDGQRAVALEQGVAVDAASGAVDDLAPGIFGQGTEVGRCLRGLPPAWRLAGLLALAFDEDLAIVDGRRATIPWIAAALPSNWAPADKVGRRFEAVHEPVPETAPWMARADRLAALLCGAEAYERSVWTLTGHARLHAHPARVAPEPWPRTSEPDALAALTWLRTEQQRLLPLPALQQAVFCIRVDVQPLEQAVRQPGLAARLHDALASMSPAVLHYRRLTEVQAPLLQWLAARAASAEHSPATLAGTPGTTRG